MLSQFFGLQEGNFQIFPILLITSEGKIFLYLTYKPGAYTYVYDQNF